MAQKKKEVQKVGPLTEGKKNIISALMEEYDIETADDIQEHSGIFLEERSSP